MKSRRSVPLLAAIGFLTGVAASVAQSAAPPNVVVILSDDVGWGDPGCYGATKVKTPNIDALARGGLRFTDGHASAAVCTPTRYSLLTGQYSWRVKATGLDQGVANGDSPLLISTNAVTLPGILKNAGYRTAVIGKWHLGFGKTAPDFNAELSPGPLDIGFDEAFVFPATNDRVPTVFIRDRKVVNLDPADPIRYTYNEETANKEGLRRYAAGRERIGWMSGGKAAWWNDIDIADTFTREAVSFIERNHEKPFFLFFTPHDVHPPTIPHPRFKGSSGLGARADMLHELDWSVGEILKALEKHGLTRHTLVVFSSDNGANPVDEDGHKPNGPWRGKKSQLWEGGHRVPLIVHWPDRVKPGVSPALVSLHDLPATIAAITKAPLTEDAAPDSFNLLPVLTGESAAARDHLVLQSGMGALAIRQGSWKYIPDLSTADGWGAWKQKKAGAATFSGPGLYNLEDDPREERNLHAEQPEISKKLAALLEIVRSAPSRQ
ncbi:MAG TPA: arylsulfatase [Candidatus Paceibacterota bacterium]|nr:arylsulfatase [Candidatus Paceibacterota bacterium]